MKKKQRKAILKKVEEMLEMDGVEAGEAYGTECFLRDSPGSFPNYAVRLDGSRTITISVPPGSYE